MGAYVLNDLHLHDDEVEEFVKLATAPYVRDGNVSDWEFAMRDVARYIAQRFIDVEPSLAEACGSSGPEES